MSELPASEPELSRGPWSPGAVIPGVLCATAVVAFVVGLLGVVTGTMDGFRIGLMVYGAVCLIVSLRWLALERSLASRHDHSGVWPRQP